MKEKRTKSYLQTVKFFEDFVRKDEVADFIEKFREHLKLPKNGLTLTEQDLKEFSECLVPIFFLPKKSEPFWAKNDRKEGIRIINTCKAFVHHCGIDSIYIEIMLRNFIFFNKIIDIPKIISTSSFGDDFFKIEHIPSELTWYDSEDHYLLKCMYEHFDYVGKKYPVALYINPEATQNQVKDFISKNWDDIKFYRNKQKRIGGVRSKRRQKVNDFIYKNKDLPIAKIRSKLADEMNEFLDDGHISKIIQLEKKRRK